MLLSALWVGFSALVGYLGRNREFGFWGFFLASVLLSPVIMGVILFVTQVSHPKRPAQD